MDSHMRQHLGVKYDYKCNGCQDTSRPELDQDFLDAVDEGNVEDIVDNYIRVDADVNALLEEECLLSRACAKGQAEIVSHLLQCPDIHLNILFETETPMSRAAKNGHLECVKLLLNANVACSPRFENSWKTIAKYLDTEPDLQYRSAVYLLERAKRVCNWDVINSLLKMKHDYPLGNLRHVVRLALDQNRLDVVFAVLKRDFHGKSEIVKEVLVVVVKMRDWDSMNRILQILGNDLKFDESFVKAALCGNATEVQRLLSDGKYDLATLNGNLLVVAAGGINDQIAEILMSMKNVYTKRTYAMALYIAVLSICVELIPKLLHNPEALYSTTDLRLCQEILMASSRSRRNTPLHGYMENYLQKQILEK